MEKSEAEGGRKMLSEGGGRARKLTKGSGRARSEGDEECRWGEAGWGDEQGSWEGEE